MPVPLHRSRERARGYNQASELARHFAGSRGLAFDARALRRSDPERYAYASRAVVAEVRDEDRDLAAIQAVDDEG